jgi:hypothetical protein
VGGALSLLLVVFAMNHVLSEPLRTLVRSVTG